MFSIDGQPLPNNICLELDAVSHNTTYLDPIFKKNDILPLKKTITKQMSTSIKKDTDEKIQIKVFEGDIDSIPAANKLIGMIEISGHQLDRDLIKGSDIELTFEISESRDIKVASYLIMTDQEFENTFSPSEVNVTKEGIINELRTFTTNLNTKLKILEREGNYEQAAEVHKLTIKIESLRGEIQSVEKSQSTDEIYVLEVKKRKLGKEIQKVFGVSMFSSAVKKYYDAKKNLKSVLQDPNAEENDRAEFDRIIEQENNFISGGSITSIKMYTNQLKSISSRIHRRTPSTLEDIKLGYTFLKFHKYQDKSAANKLIAEGEIAVERNNLIKLNEICNKLAHLMKNEEKDNNDLFKSDSTGIQ